MVLAIIFSQDFSIQPIQRTPSCSGLCLPSRDFESVRATRRAALRQDSTHSLGASGPICLRIVCCSPYAHTLASKIMAVRTLGGVDPPTSRVRAKDCLELRPRPRGSLICQFTHRKIRASPYDYSRHCFMGTTGVASRTGTVFCGSGHRSHAPSGGLRMSHGCPFWALTGL